MAPDKKNIKKKAVTKEVVTREYTVNIHKRIHGVYVFLPKYIIKKNCAFEFCVGFL